MLIFHFLNLARDKIMKLTDRTGLRYGKLTVIDKAQNKSAIDTNARWNCLCDCGKTTIAYGQDLGRGKHQSCGCLHRGDAGKRNKTHGMSRTVAYRAWCQMRVRCNNPKNAKFKYYGARGIMVCERWQKFENFISDMGHPSKGLSLDRIDVNGNYEPSNCQWSTTIQQANNKRVVRLTYNNISMSVREWAEHLDISVSTFRDRMTAGFSEEKLFSTNLKMK